MPFLYLYYRPFSYKDKVVRIMFCNFSSVFNTISQPCWGRARVNQYSLVIAWWTGCWIISACGHSLFAFPSVPRTWQCPGQEPSRDLLCLHPYLPSTHKAFSATQNRAIFRNMFTTLCKWIASVKGNRRSRGLLVEGFCLVPWNESPPAPAPPRDGVWCLEEIKYHQHLFRFREHMWRWHSITCSFGCKSMIR